MHSEEPELTGTSTSLEVAPAARFGIDPFNNNPSGEYRCPLGHVAGLNILSETYVVRDSWDKADIVSSRQLVGARQGALVPHPLVLIFQRFHQIAEEGEDAGFQDRGGASRLGSSLPSSFGLCLVQLGAVWPAAAKPCQRGSDSANGLLTAGPQGVSAGAIRSREAGIRFGIDRICGMGRQVAEVASHNQAA